MESSLCEARTRGHGERQNLHSGVTQATRSNYSSRRAPSITLGLDTIDRSKSEEKRTNLSPREKIGEKNKSRTRLFTCSTKQRYSNPLRERLRLLPFVLYLLFRSPARPREKREKHKKQRRNEMRLAGAWLGRELAAFKRVDPELPPSLSTFFFRVLILFRAPHPDGVSSLNYTTN